MNDRFGNPKGGWADCSLYLHFPNSHFKDMIAEVQICHKKLLLVRKDMGAHDACASQNGNGAGDSVDRLCFLFLSTVGARV